MSPRAKHVLIVDDYPDALDIWAIYLKASGYRVSMAADGASAIADRVQYNSRTSQPSHVGGEQAYENG